MLLYLQMIDSEEERSKFEVIYETYKSQMYDVAYKILGNIQDAEDAVHYAFVKIAENMDKVEKPKSAKTRWYAITIAENQAIDMYRRSKAHPTVSYQDELNGVEIDYGEPNVYASCILKLPRRERTVLILKYWHGFSYKEIAKTMNLTYENTMKIGQRAKALLEEICKEAGIEC